MARGHTGPVLDTAWSPFDDNLVVSGSEDGKSELAISDLNDQADHIVCIWKVHDSLFEGWGEDGWVAEDLSPDGKLNAGGRCVPNYLSGPQSLPSQKSWTGHLPPHSLERSHLRFG